MVRVRRVASPESGICATPSSQTRHGGAHPPSTERAEPSSPEIGIELIPGIAHRRMAVADVHRSRASEDRFGDTGAAAHDQVELLEVELLDEDREERQAPAVVVPNAREILNQGCGNGRSLDYGRNRPGHAAQR